MFCFFYAKNAYFLGRTQVNKFCLKRAISSTIKVHFVLCIELQKYNSFLLYFLLIYSIYFIPRELKIRINLGLEGLATLASTIFPFGSKRIKRGIEFMAYFFMKLDLKALSAKS